ncbi:hypothetical protein GCM10010398_62030 [Streptomyces fimbriatus]
MCRGLYKRYMAESTAHRRHARTCTTRSPESLCETGARLYEVFSRLQDAHLGHRHHQGRAPLSARVPRPSAETAGNAGATPRHVRGR